MQNRFWQALAYRCRRAWHRAFGRTSKREPSGDRSGASRARFWTEFREGQREADARAGREP